MTTQTIDSTQENKTSMEEKIDALQAQVALLLAHQERQQELLREVMPISREVMRVMTDQLQDLEARGYFRFGAASLKILDEVVSHYSAEDLEALGQNVVGILDTLRSVTQPEILQMAHEATEAIREADQEEPLSPWGAFRQASNDKNVRHGVAVLVSVLRHLGKATRRMTHEDKLDKIAPRRLAAPRAAAPRAAAPVVPAPRAAAPVAGEVAPDPSAWSPAQAEAMAAEMGLVLGEVHWALIKFARADFSESGASPNIRRLSKGSGVSVRDLYEAFPTSPGVVIARLAGIPKPKGCI